MIQTYLINGQHIKIRWMHQIYETKFGDLKLSLDGKLYSTGHNVAISVDTGKSEEIPSFTWVNPMLSDVRGGLDYEEVQHDLISYAINHKLFTVDGDDTLVITICLRSELENWALSEMFDQRWRNEEGWVVYDPQRAVPLDKVIWYNVYAEFRRIVKK